MKAPFNDMRVFAPATTGNVGPGFDVLGLAIEGLGDVVTARRIDQPVVRLIEVVGSPELRPSDDNTACVAARGVLAALDVDWGVELSLEKGLPLGSGLGSSGASAAAAAAAVNLLAKNPLPVEALLEACAEAERTACGSAHRDNVAPALLGGVVIVRTDGSVTRVHTELQLGIALVTPQQQLPTRLARKAIPAAIPLGEVVHNSAQLATLVYALATNDLALLREAIDDRIAEPRRAHLIEGFAEVKQAALDAGALGASISGGGPSIFALCASKEDAELVTKKMSEALDNRPHQKWASTIADQGAHRVT